MSRMWLTGFEADSIYVWELIAGSPTITAVGERTDTYCMTTPATPDAANGGIYLDSLPGEVFVRVYANTQTDTPNVAATWLRLSDGDGVILLEITETGQVWLGQAGAGVDQGNAGALTTSYKRWEVRFLVDNAAGLLDIRVDGVSMVSDSGIDTRVGAVDTIGYMYVGNVSAGTLHDIKLFDDIAINDTLGADNNSWCGEGAILHGVAVANGNVNDFGRFPDAGEANWEDVDEIPPDEDTTYVLPASIADTELYEITDFEAIYGLSRATQVKAVAWWIRARLRYNGDGQLGIMHRQGGLSSEVDQYDVNELLFAYVNHVADINPATAAGWTIGEVDDSEFGFRSRAP